MRRTTLKLFAFSLVIGISLNLASAVFASDGASGDTAASLRPNEQADEPAPYPEALCKAGVGGKVPLMVTVDAVGRPYGIQVETTSGQRDLDRAAVKAATRWRYFPAVIGGRQKSGGVARFTVEFDPQSESCKRMLD